MNQLQKMSQQFEKLCIELFDILGYRVEQGVLIGTGTSTREIDAVLHRRHGKPSFVEIKWTRNNPVSLRQLRDWALRIASSARVGEAAAGLLIVPGMVAPIHRKWLEREFNVDIWDREALVLRAKRNDNLTERFSLLFAETDRLQVAMERTRQVAAESISEDADLIEPKFEATQLLGQSLTKRLRNILPGKEQAQLYEDICLEIINYLFHDDLLNPQPQRSLVSRLSIAFK
jgi:hypothetical protein